MLYEVITMDPRALDVVSASQILVCGTLLTHVRRLGVEYVTLYGPAPPEELLWWCGNLTDALERHPVGPKPGMVTELRDLRNNFV